MASRARLAALVLAGGPSARLQRFKPLLRLDGLTLLERALAPFAAAGVGELLVVAGHRAEELTAQAERAGARCVFNPRFSEGMFTSVQAGLRALGPGVEAVFVQPADMPALRSSTVELLARTLRQTGAGVVYPAFRGTRGHPPLISARLLPALLAAEGRFGLRRALGSHAASALELGVLDEGVLLDVDTSTDLERAAALCRDRGVPSPAECEALLAALHVNRGVLLHGRAVARAAVWLGERLREAGVALDLQRLHAAAVLHDLAKGEPDHARQGAALLSSLGFLPIAPIVEAHMDLPRCGGPLDEAAVLFFADKLVKGDRLVGLDARFGAVQERFQGDPAALRSATARRAKADRIAAALDGLLAPGWAAALARELEPSRLALHAEASHG